MSPAFCNIMYVIICMSHPGGGTLFGCPLIHLSTNKAKKLQALCSTPAQLAEISSMLWFYQLLEIVAELQLLSITTDYC